MLNERTFSDNCCLPPPYGALAPLGLKFYIFTLNERTFILTILCLTHPCKNPVSWGTDEGGGGGFIRVPFKFKHAINTCISVIISVYPQMGKAPITKDVTGSFKGGGLEILGENIPPYNDKT